MADSEISFEELNTGIKSNITNISSIISDFINDPNTPFFYSLTSGYGSTSSSDWDTSKNYWSLIGSKYSKDFQDISDNGLNKSSVGSILLNTLNAAGLAIGEGAGIIKNTAAAVPGILSSGAEAISNITNAVVTEDNINYIDSYLTSVENMLDNAGETVTSTANGAAQGLRSVSQYMGKGSTFMSVLAKGLQIFSDSLVTYYDGVSETSFGYLMEESWSSGSNSFVSTLIKGNANYKVNILNSTPFDSGSNMENIYGTMMLGCPPTFNNISDPKNRSLLNTFLRDARFISLTPGYPKYNGSSYLMKQSDDSYHQTTTGNAMIEYLLSNGLNQNFANKDRRYYTFKTAYDDYYSYLETMLNAIYVKMGLASSSNSEFNIFSFFDGYKGEGDHSYSNGNLKPQYKSPLSFFVNPTGALAESINNSQTGYGSEAAATANSNSDTYQRINFITGMGTGGNMRNASATLSKSLASVSAVKTFISDSLKNTVDAISNFDAKHLISSIANVGFGVVNDTTKFLTEQDNGAVLQSFSTTNGMKVQYPELWENSSYMKSININFEFTSPYGDPESIFKYVFAPFCALMTYAMPRQAADNGLVSPFFVRANVPGYFTSDLAFISDINWTKGGSAEMWTKDGLPRSINGSFTIIDLYPYLAMTKRLSFLSANPNYTGWIDSLVSINAQYETDESYSLNNYWKKMLSMVSGDQNDKLWNAFNTSDRAAHKKMGNSTRDALMKTKPSNITWFRNLQ